MSDGRNSDDYGCSYTSMNTKITSKKNSEPQAMTKQSLKVDRSGSTIDDDDKEVGESRGLKEKEEKLDYKVLHPITSTLVVFSLLMLLPEQR